nr:CocE/NonD family hydrolase [bacterium]
WYTLPTWPPKSTPLTLRLDKGKLTTDRTVTPWSAHFDCDPSNPVPTLGGPNLQMTGMKAGPYDQREIEQHGDVIALRGDPLDKRVTIAGAVTARLYVSTDAVDTDVMVKLVDVYPDGRSLLVADRAMRLSWWCRQHELGAVQPGRVYEISFSVGERAWVFERGHRIGFDVQASNYPRFDVNPGTGAQLSDDRMVVQHNVLHAGPLEPSGFVLPLYSP